MSTVLDFEEPIVELERKVQELRDFSAQRDVDMTHGIEELQKRIGETRRQIFENLTPWQRVQLARHPERPHPIEYVEELCTDFLELKGDRRYADDRAIFGGFARLGEQRVMLIGTRKGRNLKQNVDVNFGSAHPEGYRKALRLMQLADRSGCPIVSLIDTPGAYPGIAAEERHIGEAIAVNLLEMFRLSVPVVVVVTGEGGSGGALGIGVGNRVLIMENAYYSVITPEGCAAILWRDGAAAPKAAAALRLTSKDLLGFGIVDGVVPEPPSGAHRDLSGAAASLGNAITAALEELQSLSPDELRAQRYEKFRALGVYEA
jgi:acetyl-CoA carboxylase carboxyl transferase subunit alpha